MSDGHGRLWQAIRPLAATLWIVAALRIAADALAPDRAWMFGLFFASPVVLLYAGLRGTFRGWRFGRFVVAMLLLGALVWSVSNAAAYATAVWMDWNHGRFDPDGSGPPYGAGPPFDRSTVAGALGFVLLPTVVGAIAGAIWCTVFGSLLAFLPARRRATAQT